MPTKYTARHRLSVDQKHRAALCLTCVMGAMGGLGLLALTTNPVPLMSVHHSGPVAAAPPSGPVLIPGLGDALHAVEVPSALRTTSIEFKALSAPVAHEESGHGGHKEGGRHRAGMAGVHPRAADHDDAQRSSSGWVRSDHPQDHSHYLLGRHDHGRHHRADHRHSHVDGHHAHHDGGGHHGWGGDHEHGSGRHSGSHGGHGRGR